MLTTPASYQQDSAIVCWSMRLVYEQQWLCITHAVYTRCFVFAEFGGSNSFTQTPATSRGAAQRITYEPGWFSHTRTCIRRFCGQASSENHYHNNANTAECQHPQRSPDALTASVCVKIQALHCCKWPSSIGCVIGSMSKAFEACCQHLHGHSMQSWAAANWSPEAL